MASRLELHAKLIEILGSHNVYYQPPASLKMNYPAIVYSLDDIHNVFADDSVYSQYHAYQVTLIDKNPDSVYVDRISNLKHCRFNRRFTSDNLNHTVFKLIY